MLKIQKQKFAILLVVGVVLVLPVMGNVVLTQDVQAISRACQNSAECMAAVEAEQAANEAAANASETASEYQKAVANKDVEIAEKKREIASTQAEVNDLNKQIKETEQKLEDEQEALAELLVNMHFEGDAEPITILAGSTSISDLAEKSARSEVVKQQISATAQSIKDAKKKLEDDKAQVETLLAQQKKDKEELATVRAEQQALVDKYQNDADAYEKVAEAAREAQRAAEKAEQEAHPELYRGSSYTGANTYPWQADCPAKQDYYITYWNDGVSTYKIGGYVCECVSYAGWKAYEAWGVGLGWGNAYSWDDGARADSRFYVDHTPAANTIGQMDSGPYGHVFWVESVNADGSINVTEYNNSYATYLYSGSSHFGDFGARKISASDLWQYNFIHLK
ncbi:CHAP domain-containing protein [Candidatus Saccharibacteria bacterium]|nr:CHAP domain-containing protein [Candidatus Saccharibacteria bacterium]